MGETETCSHCGQTKPIKLALRNPQTGEDTLLCEICSTRWLLSEEEFPPKAKDKEPTLANT